MPNDPMQNKVRFRLRVDGECWVIDRGAYAPKKGAFGWTPASRHQKLAEAIRYSIEHVVREGYSAKGLDNLLTRIEQATALVDGWVRELQRSMDAELELH